MRDSDTVARIGGDEFVLLLRSVGEQADQTALAVYQAKERGRNQVGLYERSS